IEIAKGMLQSSPGGRDRGADQIEDDPETVRAKLRHRLRHVPLVFVDGDSGNIDQAERVLVVALSQGSLHAGGAEEPAIDAVRNDRGLTGEGPGDFQDGVLRIAGQEDRAISPTK